MKVRLGDVSLLINGDRGKNYPSQVDIVADGDVPFVNAGHLNDGNIDFSEMNYISTVKYESLNSGKFTNGDILYCLRGSLGKKAFVAGEINGAIASSLVIIRADTSKVLGQYLMFALDSSAIQEQLRKSNNGSSQPNLSAASVREYRFELPDIPTQAVIVERLSVVKKIIYIQKQQLIELDNLVKARFVEMFGDPVSNPMEWPICQLSEYIEFLTSGSRGWAQYFSKDGEYFITIKNVKNCRVTLNDVQHIVAPDNAEAKRTKVQEGDLLISITADLGRTGVVTKEIAEHGGYINQHLTCIRLKKDQLNPLYVAYYMESDAGKCQFQSKNQSAVKAGLNFNSIHSLRLMVPPLERQNDFVSFVAQVDKSKVVVQKALDEAQMLFDSLMQEYFG